MMSASAIKLSAYFEPDTRFELGAAPPAPFRGTVESELDLVKKRLLLKLLDEHTDPALNAVLRRAANKAATLAEFTGFPLLVFPSLLEELAAKSISEYRRACRWHQAARPMLVEAA